MNFMTVPDDFIENPVKYWTHLRQYKDAADQPRFANISRLATALYSLPFSNAEVERIVSKMNYFKNILCEEYHSFDVTDEMKKKFNSEVIYNDKPDKDIFVARLYVIKV